MIKKTTINLDNAIGLFMELEGPLADNAEAAIGFHGAIHCLARIGRLPRGSDYTDTPFEKHADESTHEGEELRLAITAAEEMEVEECSHGGSMTVRITLIEKRTREKKWLIEAFFADGGCMKSFSLAGVPQAVLIRR